MPTAITPHELSILSPELRHLRDFVSHCKAFHNRSNDCQTPYLGSLKRAQAEITKIYTYPDQTRTTT